MNQMKNTKGITLISLVITIIVLLLLAGVTMATLTGENGILTRASSAKTQTEIASIKEEIQTEILGEQAEKEGNISDHNLETILLKYGTLSNEEKLIDKTLTTTKGNHEIKVSDIFKGKLMIADKSGANPPNLNKIAQKTYVTWNLEEEKAEYVINDKQTVEPEYWYDYEKGKWANIKTSNSGLEAYWVWIPRYEYVVPTSTLATQIEVKFISKNQTTPDTDKNYIIHPAFTNEGNGGLGELDGIWVAKFEAVSSTPTVPNGGGDNPNLKVQVIPNQPSWRTTQTNNIFSVCRRMTKEGEVLAGSTIDSHMMKNTEWGAVVILSQSKYGVYNPESMNGEKGNKEYQIWNNPSSAYITGSVGTGKDTSSTVSKYNSVNGPKASTTGTVYGVYDIAGGAWEYVAGVLKGEIDELEYAKSKFDISNQEKPNGMTELDFVKKYLDLYDYRESTTDYSQYIIGDATVETKKWNVDYADFVCVDNPIFIRGR
ncbi:MAG: hypothetical protein HFJ37_00020 [Clostridia bacterium]|nr:hypothetical protein [Clostridia bacterium]